MPLSKSPALCAALASIGIETPFQVIEHLPHRYESFEYTPRKESYDDKERIVVLGSLRGSLAHPLRFSHRSLIRFYFETTSGEVFQVEAWNQDYLSSYLHPGEQYTLLGVYSKKRHSLSLMKIVKGEVSKENALHPLYSLPNSIPNRVFAALVKRCLEVEKGRIPDVLPPALKAKYRLCSHEEALHFVHFPSSKEDIHQGLRTLKYEEALLFELKNQIVRGENRALLKDRRRTIDKEKLSAFIKTLPYSLTPDQSQVLQECLADMDSPHVMYRLLQGDVGTGKTLVAALLAYANHLRSEQTALLAPTDALARQHYETMKKLFAGTSMSLGLLVGSLDPESHRQVCEDLEDGTLDFVIGTHALFAKSVTYAYLGLAIIDEQHKFGVNQRTLLVDKGEHADLLLMSATPIPRTLSLTLYGDLDVSTLTVFPSGKRQVTTAEVDPASPKIQEAVRASIASKHRVYVVVPQIEGTEENCLTSVKKVYELYQKLYPGKVTMLHGSLSEEDKEVANAAFRSGICPILVATSLIEVGLDVKEANLMVIYSPTHFALSSLHQLRGRIGRDGTPATCLLAYEVGEDEEEAKLKVLLSSDDGFKIAEEDLRLRGPGELAGVKQSGLPDFQNLNLIDDFKIFECARDDATRLLSGADDPWSDALIERARKDAKSASLA